MAATFECQIVTPEKIVFKGQVTSVNLPAEDGQLGILANHAPLLTGLGKGVLKIETSGEGTRTWALSGGLLEVHGNICSVLADSVE